MEILRHLLQYTEHSTDIGKAQKARPFICSIQNHLNSISIICLSDLLLVLTQAKNNFSLHHDNVVTMQSDLKKKIRYKFRQNRKYVVYKTDTNPTEFRLRLRILANVKTDESDLVTKIKRPYVFAPKEI